MSVGSMALPSRLLWNDANVPIPGSPYPNSRLLASSMSVLARRSGICRTSAELTGFIEATSAGCAMPFSANRAPKIGFLENASVPRPRRETRCRTVLLKHLMCLVFVAFSVRAFCRAAGITSTTCIGHRRR
jgi:hypothetical protein